MPTEVDRLLEDIATEKRRFESDEPDMFAVVSVLEPDSGFERVELLQERDTKLDLATALLRVISESREIPHMGWVPLDVRVADRTHSLEAAVEGIDGPIRMRFADGSGGHLEIPNRTVHLAGSGSAASGGSGSLTISHTTDAHLVVLDAGPALLEPITREEFGGIESLIGELYKAQGRGDIAPEHARKILELAELLKDVARSTVPDETPRWKPIGAIRSVLRRLFQNPFRDALALSQILEIIANVNWRELHTELQQFLP